MNHVNEFTPAAIPMNADDVTNSIMQLTGDYGPIPESPEQMAALREAIAETVEDFDGLIYHLIKGNPVRDGMIFGRASMHAVYIAENKAMRVMLSHMGSFNPESDWMVTPDEIHCRVFRGDDIIAKRWTPFRNPDGSTSWEVTYNEHPAHPTHMGGGRMPKTAAHFLKELAAQLYSNRVLGKIRDEKLNDRQTLRSDVAEYEIENYVSALDQWQLNGAMQPPRTFTDAEMDRLTKLANRLRFLHNCADPNALKTLFAELDFLTWPATPLLSELLGELNVPLRERSVRANSRHSNRLVRSVSFNDHYGYRS